MKKTAIIPWEQGVDYRRAGKPLAAFCRQALHCTSRRSFIVVDTRHLQCRTASNASRELKRSHNGQFLGAANPWQFTVHETRLLWPSDTGEFVFETSSVTRIGGVEESQEHHSYTQLLHRKYAANRPMIHTQRETLALLAGKEYKRQLG